MIIYLHAIDVSCFFTTCRNMEERGVLLRVLSKHTFTSASSPKNCRSRFNDLRKQGYVDP